MPHIYKPVRYQNIKQCVVSGWHIIPLDARVMRKLEIFMINIENILNSFDVSELIKLVEIHAKNIMMGIILFFHSLANIKLLLILQILIAARLLAKSMK